MLIGSSFASVNPGQWLDDSFAQGIPDATYDRVIGYFVEYEASQVPEPSTIVLFATGIVGLAAMNLRRKKK